jgi:thiol-disulfide isomerase/thioredoxin
VLSSAAATGVEEHDARRADMQAILAGHVFQTLDGGALSVSEMQGAIVVLNFWATWCKPCQRELPELAALHADLGNAGVRILAVSIDRDGRNVRKFVDRHRIDVPVAHDGPDGIAEALDLDRIPYTVVIDRDGAIAFEAGGSADPSLRDLRAAIDRVVARETTTVRVAEGPTR